MINSNLQLTICGEIQLSYIKKETYDFRAVHSSLDTDKILRSIFPSNEINFRERMYALYLNNANQVIGYQLISIGGIKGTVVDIRIILQGALLSHSAGILISHKHPSGKLITSQADIHITKELKEACAVTDIQLLDHIILAEEAYYSFADEGEL